MTTFYLVRHAHAEWTPDENRPLSRQGYEDAKRVSDILKDYPVRLIYSSPAQRAYQTISPFAEQLKLPICVDPDLRERKLGDKVFEDFFEAVEVTWRDPFFSHPGGESSAEAQKRGIAIVQQLLEEHPSEHVVLSTHGNLMALILQAFVPSVNYMFWKSLSMPDIYTFFIGQTGFVEPQRLWL